MNTNIIFGYFYKHLNVNLNELNDGYLKELLDKFSRKNKNEFPLGDFYINLLNYGILLPANKPLELILSLYFFSHILQLTRLITAPRY